MERHILHVDMDAFFAAVEQRDDPALRDKPVLVGGDPNARGVVSTASYEARKFGCHSAMPMAQALRLCPHAIVVRGDYSKYAEASRQIFEVFETFTPTVEPLSIDEAFLDITGSTRLFGTPEHIAREIKRLIKERTQLTASVGVAPNKFLAKIASDLQKPDGLVVVPTSFVESFLEPLPISRLWGAGKSTLKRFDALGVKTFGDALFLAEETWLREFGEVGRHFAHLVRGIDDRPVETEYEAKSISHEVTFPKDVTDLEHVRAVLLGLLDNVSRRLRQHGRLARTVVVKIRDPEFVTITRRKGLNTPTDRTDVLWQAVSTLFEAWRRDRATPVRLIGVGVTGFVDEQGQQLELFGSAEDEKKRRLDQAVDEIRDRFGNDSIKRGNAKKHDQQPDQ